MTSSSPARSRPSGFFATRSVVGAQPALATTGSDRRTRPTQLSSECGFFFSTWIQSQSITLGYCAPRSQRGVQVVTPERLRATDQDGQQSRRGVARLPEPVREFLLRLRRFADAAAATGMHAVIVYRVSRSPRRVFGSSRSASSAITSATVVPATSTTSASADPDTRFRPTSPAGRRRPDPPRRWPWGRGPCGRWVVGRRCPAGSPPVPLPPSRCHAAGQVVALRGGPRGGVTVPAALLAAMARQRRSGQQHPHPQAEDQGQRDTARNAPSVLIVRGSLPSRDTV